MCVFLTVRMEGKHEDRGRSSVVASTAPHKAAFANLRDSPSIAEVEEEEISVEDTLQPSQHTAKIQ